MLMDMLIYIHKWTLLSGAKTTTSGSCYFNRDPHALSQVNTSLKVGFWAAVKSWVKGTNLRLFVNVCIYFKDYSFTHFFSLTLTLYISIALHFLSFIMKPGKRGTAIKSVFQEKAFVTSSSSLKHILISQVPKSQLATGAR